MYGNRDRVRLLDSQMSQLECLADDYSVGQGDGFESTDGKLDSINTVM